MELERRSRLGDARRMRFVIALCLGLFVVPALAAGWGHYVNERFGVEADVPPGFAAGAPPANGDGLGFSTPTAKLSIYGSLIVEGDFESMVAQRIAWDQEEGWNITYQASTPGWATWSGRKGDRIVYTRAIRMCGGDVYGAFGLEYSSADLKAFNPIIDRLVGSLRDSGTGWQC